MRLCGNFYFNSQYCGFKTLSGLRLLQPLIKSRFSVKYKCLRRLQRSASGYFASASQVFCFTTHQGSLYQLTSLADGRFHIVASMHLQYLYSGKKSDAVCGFLTYFCAVLRFSDPPYAPLPHKRMQKPRSEPARLTELEYCEESGGPFLEGHEKP